MAGAKFESAAPSQIIKRCADPLPAVLNVSWPPVMVRLELLPPVLVSWNSRWPPRTPVNALAWGVGIPVGVLTSPPGLALPGLEEKSSIRTMLARTGWQSINSKLIDPSSASRHGERKQDGTGCIFNPLFHPRTNHLAGEPSVCTG